jgi:hypothetical protein
LRFYLILLAAVAVVAAGLILVLKDQPTVAVEWASTEFSAKYNMLVLRDEVVYEAKNYGKTDFIAVEGQHVDVGDPIVEVYEWGYNDETLSILLDLQKKILTYQTEVRLAAQRYQPAHRHQGAGNTAGGGGRQSGEHAAAGA